ncbi:NAD(P)+-dependent aldehyde dehydrogenase superfamily [Candidatus Termititenax persephonae]|uniref:NAD(P)+-dependent aldehyde dehydrogenase superfamily n=1 Tax=Candidatus Termititenax persephonae TaxID=2218525 RepID=A0A388THU5_9BACT|nr:NAD(P)+-dependent aldehyde dehydrogenase superfamily [Candidatus Termititenax persephonae]
MDKTTYYLLIDGEKVRTKVREIFIPVKERMREGNKEDSAAEQKNPDAYPIYFIATALENKKAAVAARRAAKLFRKTAMETRIAVLRSWREKLNQHKQKIMEISLDEGLSWEMLEWEFQTINSVILSEESLARYAKMAAPSIPSVIEGNYILRQPLGVIGIVAPFNAVLLLGVLPIAAQIITGNASIIKAPSVCPLSTLYICELLQEALNAENLPPGIINVLVGMGEIIIEEWLKERLIDGLVFIGGSGIGLKVGRACLSRGIKPILELAGSDACVVDKTVTNLPAIAELLVKARFTASGQICISLKRLIVQEDIYAELLELLKENIARLKLGLPGDIETQIVPLAHADTVRYLMFAISEAVNAGAKIICGGHRVDYQGRRVHSGLYFQPTLIANVTADMAVMQNEILGPVLPVIAFKTQEEAIALVNNSRFGLRASLWSNNQDFIRDFIEETLAGSIIINDFHLWLGGDVMHLGGFKQSSGTNNGGKYFINELLASKYIARGQGQHV